MNDSPSKAVFDDQGNRFGHETKLLQPAEERDLMRELEECRRRLANLPGRDDVDEDDGRDGAGHDAGPVGRPGWQPDARRAEIRRRYREIRGRLVMANMPLVAHIAKRYSHRGVPFADLIQEGVCGLIEAIDRFDPAQENRLATYATWWIRQHLQKSVASSVYPVRLTPRHLWNLSRSQADANCHESREGLAQHAEPESMHYIRMALRPTISLDATTRGESSFSLLHVLASKEDDSVERSEAQEVVNSLLDRLVPRERRILSLRFGLGGEESHSLHEVGRLLDLSKERVRQIQDAAIRRLKAMLSGDVPTAGDEEIPGERHVARKRTSRRPMALAH